MFSALFYITMSEKQFNEILFLSSLALGRTQITSRFIFFKSILALGWTQITSRFIIFFIYPRLGSNTDYITVYFFLIYPRLGSNTDHITVYYFYSLHRHINHLNSLSDASSFDPQLEMSGSFLYDALEPSLMALFCCCFYLMLRTQWLDGLVSLVVFFYIAY